MSRTFSAYGMTQAPRLPAERSRPGNGIIRRVPRHQHGWHVAGREEEQRRRDTDAGDDDEQRQKAAADERGDEQRYGAHGTPFGTHLFDGLPVDGRFWPATPNLRMRAYRAIYSDFTPTYRLTVD